MTKLLLHVCCGPCATATVAALKEKHELVGFFYNPNIHPYSEYRRRYIYAQRFFWQQKLPLLTGDYELKAYFQKLNNNFQTPERCQACYRLRLEKTAVKAVAMGIKTISTTLLISPYQEHDKLKETGKAVAAAWDLSFYYQDLRHLLSLSRQMAKEQELYLQKYCGCLFSEMERSKQVKISNSQKQAFVSR